MSEWIISTEDIDDITGGGFTVGQKLVRCKDCKYWNPNGIGFCTIHDIRPSQLDMVDWFCADGEKG